MKTAGVARLSVAAALVLVACGGGPDPVGLDTPTPTPTPTPPVDTDDTGMTTPPEPVSVEVPDVVGRKLAKARTLLKDAGLSVSRSRKASDEAPGTVISQRPAAGTDVQEGRTVRLTVAKPKPTPSPTCHSSYTGACLDPNSPDYDCAGGTGDGPDYTGPVTVVGPDEYGLDGDGDGQGCE